MTKLRVKMPNSAPAMTVSTPTMTLREVAARVDRTPRTLRSWMAAGALPSSGDRGPRARYDAAFMVRARAVDLLLRGKTSLATVRRRLAKMTDDDIGKLVDPTPPVPTMKSPPAAPTYAAAKWERIEVLPGLEIHVRADQLPLRRLAQQIVDAFGGA